VGNKKKGELVMPVTNLLNSDARLRHSAFRDANGQFPVIKERNRMGNIVYTISDNPDDVQTCYRILVYEILNQDIDAFNYLKTSTENYRYIHNDVTIERKSIRNWANNTRRLVGIIFRVPIHSRGGWGRYQSWTFRTIGIPSNRKVTYTALRRKFDELKSMMDEERARRQADEARRTRERNTQEARIRQATQVIEGALTEFPLNMDTDSFRWENDYKDISLTISIDRYHVGKLLEQLHRIRTMKNNPLDIEYLNSKAID
jgi:hypothetical protein